MMVGAGDGREGTAPAAPLWDAAEAGRPPLFLLGCLRLRCDHSRLLIIIPRPIRLFFFLLLLLLRTISVSYGSSPRRPFRRAEAVVGGNLCQHGRGYERELPRHSRPHLRATPDDSPLTLPPGLRRERTRRPMRRIRRLGVCRSTFRKGVCLECE